MPGLNNRAKGRDGEALAEEYLTVRGYDILEKNYRNRFGEIDIIALDEQSLMVTGLNSDIDYNGKVYHIQTEDGGINNPIILTRIFCTGVLITTRKTSYVYQLDIDGIKTVVENLMKEQHNEMIQELHSG